MKVTLDKTFPLPAAADVAWALLQDVPGVAACMPGANLTEQIDATHYKGTVAVKFGPASMAFRGEIEVMSVDAAAKTIRLVGKGTDSTGGSGASMDLTARLEAIDATSCNLLGVSEVSMSGKAAAFGGRMMGSVSDQILKQFAANFANKVQALQSQAATRPPPPQDGGVQGRGPDGGQPVPGVAQPAADATLAPSSARDTGRPAATAPTAFNANPAHPSRLNALALLWAIFKDWLRTLFGAKRA
jgi:carbon monoxide dehydrogenase subunit G